VKAAIGAHGEGGDGGLSLLTGLEQGGTVGPPRGRLGDDCPKHVIRPSRTRIWSISPKHAIRVSSNH